ncbi:MAG: hypothetical protein ACRET2_07240 [Steroidobacteraceae bacterium]
MKALRPAASIQGLAGGALLAIAAIAALPSLAAAAPASRPASEAPIRVPRHELTGHWVAIRVRGFPKHTKYTGAVPPPDTPPPPLRPKYLAAWTARQVAVRAANLRGQPLYDRYAACIPDGMPAMMMAMFPMDVLQTPGQITIIEEAYRQVRYIYLGKKQIPAADAEPEFWGHSVGRWVGDTLHVDTVGIRSEVRFRDAPHSDLMRIDERIRLLSPNEFEDRITIVDPVYLTKPWTFTWKYKRRSGYKMLEYVCESNHVYEDPKNGAQRMKLFSDPGKHRGGS